MDTIQQRRTKRIDALAYGRALQYSLHGRSPALTYHTIYYKYTHPIKRFVGCGHTGCIDHPTTEISYPPYSQGVHKSGNDTKGVSS